MTFPLGAVLFLLEPKSRGSSLIYDSVSSSPRPRQLATTRSGLLRMWPGVRPLRKIVRSAQWPPELFLLCLVELQGDYWTPWVLYFLFSTFTIATIVLVTPWSVDRENTSAPRLSLHPSTHHCTKSLIVFPDLWDHEWRLYSRPISERGASFLKPDVFNVIYTIRK